jgi:hypothetical protein
MDAQGKIDRDDFGHAIRKRKEAEMSILPIGGRRIQISKKRRHICSVTIDGVA